MTHYPDPRSLPESSLQRTIREQGGRAVLPHYNIPAPTPVEPRQRVMPMGDPFRGYDPTPGQIRPVYYAPPTPTSGLAVTALVLGLLGGGLLALLFGLCALPAINAGRRRGDGVATAGIVLGTLGMAGWFLLLLAVGTITP